jgi:hypothetical protein
MLGEVDARAPAPGGGSTSRRRPRSPMQQWSYGIGSWFRVIWVATWSCAGSKFVDLTGSASGARSLIQLLRRGGGPGFGATFVVCGQSTR